MPRVAAFLCAVLLVTAAARPARANLAEVFGFGSRQAGLCGAAAARVEDFSAGYYNPAGLGFARGKHFTLGFLGAESNLHANGADVPITSSFGFVVGGGAPLPLGGKLANRLHVGFGLFVLPRTLIRVIARKPDEPFYPYYDNRTQRLVVLPSLAVRASERVSLGLAVNFLAGLSGPIASSEGPTRGLEARVDQEIGTHARLHAGARVAVTPAYQVALVFRQAFSVPFRTQSQNNVAGQPIDVDVDAEGLFTPSQLTLGQSLAGLLPVDLSLDATWARWSTWRGPFVRVTAELPLAGELEGQLPAVPWKDTFGVRLGAERALPGGFAVRGGAGFETSPVPARQPGVTNLLDGPKYTGALGLGWRSRDLGGRRLRIDLHVMAQVLGARTLAKTIAAPGEDPAPFDALRDEVRNDPAQPETLGAQISNPGYPTLDSGGQVFSGGVTVEIEL